MKRVLLLIAAFYLFSLASLAQKQDCSVLYDAAMKDYNAKKYQSALNTFKFLNERKDGCKGYKDVNAKIADCNNKIADDKLFLECQLAGNYDKYLKKYPHGMHSAEANQHKGGNKQKSSSYDKNAERDLFNWCMSSSAEEGDCLNYLITYQGTSAPVDHINKVKAQRKKIVDRDNKRREELRKQARQTAYMNIRRVEFANLDDNDNVLSGFGSAIYAADLKFLTPRIVYDGILDIPEAVTISCKIFDPNGKLKVSSNSSRYTFTDSFLVMTGKNNNLQLSSYGSSTQGFFTPGNYTFQIWYEDRMIYQTEVYIGNKSGDAITQDYWRNALSRCKENASQNYGSDGSYKGQLKNGNRSGLGMYSWNNGARYIGSWNAGSRSGMGIYIAAKGKTVKNCERCTFYVGEWSGNVKSGTGRCYDAFGHLIYDGRFSNDNHIQTYPADSENKNLMFKCYDYSSGCYYVGETRNGKAHGKGMLIWTYKGDMWYGDFEYGERSGYGVFISNAGDVISSGYWQGDNKQ